MTRAQIVAAAIRAVESIRAEWVPNPRTRYKTSTGNMAFNALRYQEEGGRFVIYMDESIAPYVPYTNEPWLSPRWGGKQNPNEGWWQRFCEEFARRFAAELRAEVKAA